jgi:hypothetical protein
VSYEILIEEREPIDGWSVCTICLNVDRTANLSSRNWKCVGCGVSTANDSQRALKDYLVENTVETLEKNLRAWSTVKGMRAAYKMLRSARFKCLIVLGRRLHGEPALAERATPPPTDSSSGSRS